VGHHPKTSLTTFFFTRKIMGYKCGILCKTTDSFLVYSCRYVNWFIFSIGSNILIFFLIVLCEGLTNTSSFHLFFNASCHHNYISNLYLLILTWISLLSQELHYLTVSYLVPVQSLMRITLLCLSSLMISLLWFANSQEIFLILTLGTEH
jgi:hypothetical protein